MVHENETGGVAMSFIYQIGDSSKTVNENLLGGKGYILNATGKVRI